MTSPPPRVAMHSFKLWKVHASAYSEHGMLSNRTAVDASLIQQRSRRTLAPVAATIAAHARLPLRLEAIVHSSKHHEPLYTIIDSSL